MKFKEFDYERARDMAWKVLIQHEICDLPVMASSICKKEGFILRSYAKGHEQIEAFGLLEQRQKSDGFAVLKDGQFYIYYNEKMTVGRIRFTVCHELGHIFLGHLKENGDVTKRNREPDPNDLPIEHEANVFASRLLAPARVLHAIGVLTPERIAEVCGISLKSAKYRAGRMGVLEKRGKYDVSPLERRVAKQFEAYINQMNERG